MKSITLHLFFILTIHYSLFTIHCFSQEGLGICNSVYAGVNSVWINPSNITGSPFKIDVNIIAFDNFIDNNYVHLYKANIPSLLKNYKSTINSYNSFNIKHNIFSKIMVYDKYSSNDKNVYQSLFIQGPSVMFSYKDWGFGITTDFREGLSVLGVNSKLAKVAFEGMTYEDLSHQYINIPAFRINSAAWMEIGFTAARIITKNKDKILKAGITYKYLLGYADAYLNNKSSTIYYPNDEDMDFYYVNAAYGHAFSTSSLKVVGKGQSIDLGITYQKYLVPKLKENHKYSYEEGEGCLDKCNPNPYLLYKWKLGVSLLDIGYIRFNKDAKTYVFTDASSKWYNFSHWAPKGIDGFDNDLNAHFNNNSLAKSNKNKYIALMPMAVSTQYDYNIKGELYINATIIQRLPHFNTPGIDRENILSVTPHFDKAYFGVAMPFILYQYIYPRLGLCFRFGNNLIIGTDKLGSFVDNKLTGMDIYFSLKFNLINKCK